MIQPHLISIQPHYNTLHLLMPHCISSHHLTSHQCKNQIIMLMDNYIWFRQPHFTSSQYTSLHHNTTPQLASHEITQTTITFIIARVQYHGLQLCKICSTASKYRTFKQNQKSCTNNCLSYSTDFEMRLWYFKEVIVASIINRRPLLN